MNTLSKETTMKIEYRDKTITNLSEWKNIIFPGMNHPQWKIGLSAYSLADYIINKNGAEALKAQMSILVNEEVTLERGCPEYEVNYDEFGTGKVHDLAVWGTTQSGKRLFLSIDAQVDEPYGITLATAKRKAHAILVQGKETDRLKRVKGLLKFNFNKEEEDTVDDQIKFPLLYSTAGTLCVEADIHIMLILVFENVEFQKAKVDQNYKDLLDFLKRIKAKEVEENQYLLTLDEKELTLVYKVIE